MRIGIITFWESNDNYGQVLQAYALQQVLKNMGHNPFQIRYSLNASCINSSHPSLIKRILKIMTIYPLVKSIRRKNALRKDAAYELVIEEKNKIRKFKEFREKHILNSDIIYKSIKELRENPPLADCYITGSDQVWTMLLSNENNKAYFLDFGDSKVKRISYAASFARKSYPNELIGELKTQLKKFDAVSVREKEGIDICVEAGREDTVCVLDPTFLLDSSYYNNLFTNISTPDHYIFVYSINIRKPEELSWKEVVRYSKAQRIEIITTTSSGHFAGREILSDTKYLYATIPEWLAFIKNADIVFTTSFHGIAFCLIFNTPFVYFPLSGQGAKGNGRVLNLLNSLGLESRVYQGNLERIIDNNIDWFKVNKSLFKFKEDSCYYLNSAL